MKLASTISIFCFVICLSHIQAQTLSPIWGSSSTEWTLVDYIVATSGVYSLYTYTIEDTIIIDSVLYREIRSGDNTIGALRHDSLNEKLYLLPKSISPTGYIWDSVEHTVMDLSLNLGDTFNIWYAHLGGYFDAIVSGRYLEDDRLVVEFDNAPLVIGEPLRMIEGVGSNLTPLLFNGYYGTFSSLLGLLCNVKDGVVNYSTNFTEDCYATPPNFNYSDGHDVDPLSIFTVIPGGIQISPTTQKETIEVAIYSIEGSLIYYTNNFTERTTIKLIAGFYICKAGTKTIKMFSH
jgi:hypothetical protein